MGQNYCRHLALTDTQPLSFEIATDISSGSAADVTSPVPAVLMTKFAEIRAAHNATKAKWQRARELAAQHVEERKQREMERQASRRSSKASALEALEESKEEAYQRNASKDMTGSSNLRSFGTHEFAPRPRLQSDSTMATSRIGSKEAISRRLSQASSVQECPLLEEQPTEDPRRFLWRFGYFRGTEQPELLVDVTGHTDQPNSSWLPGQEKEEYSLSCKLKWDSPTDSRVLEWKTKMKLTGMRSRLHDNVKKEMGAEYGEHFQDTRFAHHGGVPGTTTRLRKWFQTLSGLANQGHLKTELLALLLQELEIPIPEKSDEELHELQNMLAAPTSVQERQQSQSSSPSPVRRARDHDVPKEPEVPFEPYATARGPLVAPSQHLVVTL